MIVKLTPIVAIIAIATVATLALINGINGVLLSGSMAILGGLGGYSVKKWRH